MSNTSTRTLWVKNLSQPSETVATNLFSPLGGALRKVINTRDPSRQGVLVEFPSDELASNALTALQDSVVDGVRLIVQYAPTNLTAVSTLSIGKTTNQKGSVLDRIIKTSNTNHPKFDDKPMPVEGQGSTRELVGKSKAETDSPVKDLTGHTKGEISLQNKKVDKMEEVHELKPPQAAPVKKIIITRAPQNTEGNPLKRLIITPKKLSKRQEKKNKKKGVKLIIKQHPDAILNLQLANAAPTEVSGNNEKDQEPVQKINSNTTVEPLNTQNMPQPEEQKPLDLKMNEDNHPLKNYHNTNSKSRRSPSIRDMRSISRERSRSGSYYKNSRSYRDRSYSNYRDRRYCESPRYREPHSHSRRRSRSISSQRRYDSRTRDVYRHKDDYRRRDSRDCSPRRRSYSRSWSPRSPCGSHCFHSRSRSRSFVRSRGRSLSRDSRSRELVVKKRDTSTKYNDGYRGERSLSRERNRERMRRRSPRDRYQSRSPSRSRPKERMQRDQRKRDSVSSEFRRDGNSRRKLSKNDSRYLRKRRGGKKRQNRKFSQKGKQEGARGSQSSTVVNMPEITTNTSQLSINYLIFPNLQNFYAKNGHQNPEDCSDANMPSYLYPQAKLDTVGGCEAENPESFHNDVNNVNFQPSLDNKCVYQKVEEHSNCFEISTIESKSNLADHEKAFDRPQKEPHSPEPSEPVELKAEGDGEISKASYLLTNELVCKNENFKSLINLMVATGNMEKLKKLLEKSK